MVRKLTKNKKIVPTLYHLHRLKDLKKELSLQIRVLRVSLILNSNLKK